LGRLLAALLVFSSGFAVMVLEIVGARYLAKDFGSAFHVWVSQIGVVLGALAVGYATGGFLADRSRGVFPLATPLLLGGLITGLIPNFTPPLLELLISRHPPDVPIPLVWQKLDPALGSALVFFFPCLALAMVPPWVTRWATTHPSRLGTTTGAVYAAGTLGSIVGVFMSGYVLIERMAISDIFRLVSLAMMAGAFGVAWLGAPSRPRSEAVSSGESR
jgi:predicted MFS family arabinose efflux permease